MKEERIEILKMVAEKKITVEEGERLLRALEKGEAEERESRSERFGPRHRGPCGAADWNWSERFERLGFKMQEFFENAFGSVFGDEYWFEGYETASVPVEDLPLDKETTVVLTNSRTAYRHGSADIRIRPSEDDRLHLEAEEKGTCEVLQKEKKILIFFSDDAAVRVPAAISKIKVILAKGDTDVHDLRLPLDIRAVKGDVVVRNAVCPLSIRAMKGKVTLDLSDSYAGNSDVSAMDGDINVTTGPQFSGRVEAKVGKGDIRIQSKGIKAGTYKNAFFRTESVEFGSGASDNLLSLKTMQGDITVTTRENGR
ncbi:MAG: DUF4097 family beta strand repeat-containing protein [Clostridiales bacterium]|nr:DUF4097 family beta strand repeat-containing protein [Clostridiales bacterium]